MTHLRILRIIVNKRWWGQIFNYHELSYEDNELENTDVFSVCVVTREMRTKLEEDNLKDGSTEASDVALKDTLFDDVKDHVLHGDGNMPRYSTYTDQNSCQDIDE